MVVLKAFKTIKAKKDSWILFCLSLLLSMMAVLTLLDDLHFIIYRIEANALLVSINEKQDFRANLRYYNRYYNKELNGFVIKIEGNYKKILKQNVGKYIAIYYYNSSIIYLKDYKYPSWGHIVVQVVGLLITSLGVFLSIRQIVQPSSQKMPSV